LKDLQRLFPTARITTEQIQKFEPTYTPAAPETEIREPRFGIGTEPYYIAQTRELSEGREEITEQARLREREAQQALLNARLAEIDRLSRERIKEIEREGQRQEAATGAMSLRAGLAGSPFGESAVQRVREATGRAVAAEQERAVSEAAVARGQVNVALGEIERRARETKFGIAKERIGIAEKMYGQAIKNIETIAKSGLVSWDRIKENPDYVQELTKQTGRSEEELEIFYNSWLPRAEASDFKFQEVGQDVWVWQFDRKTGEFKRRTDLDVKGMAKGVGEYKTTITPDGTVLLMPDKIDPTKSLDEQILQYGKEGQFAKPRTARTLQGGLFDEATGQWIVPPKPYGKTKPPTSYQEWQLAGGKEGTGQTYAEWLEKKPNKILSKISSDVRDRIKMMKVGNETKKDIRKYVKYKGYDEYSDEVNNLLKDYEPKQERFDEPKRKGLFERIFRR
jgi:hypothetical protein